MPHNHLDTRSLAIASGATSGSCQLEGYDLIGLLIPALPTSGTITLQVSQDNATFYSLYDGNGVQQLALPANTGNRALGSDALASVLGYKYLGVVLGAAQASAVTLTVALKDPYV